MCHEIFETETMAELCMQQGLLDEALAIYRRLAEPRAATPAPGGGSRPHRGAGRGDADAGRRCETPGAARRRPTGDEVEIEWRLPPDDAAPALQLCSCARTTDGIVTETRTCRWRRARPTVLAVPGLHSRARRRRAHGRRAFVPLGR